MKANCFWFLAPLLGIAQAQEPEPSKLLNNTNEILLEQSFVSEQEILQTSPLSDLLKKQIEKVKDKALLDVLVQDVNLVPTGRKLQNWSSMSLKRLEENTKARLHLYQLSSSNIPDDLLSTVYMNLSKKSLAHAAVASNVDINLWKTVTSKLPFNQGVQIYSPLTPEKNDLPANKPVIPEIGKIDSTTGRNNQQVWRVGFNSVAALANVSVSPYKIVCSGTVIGNRWFLTAAHCLFNRETKAIYSISDLSIFLSFQDDSDIIVNARKQQSTRMMRVPIAAANHWFDETSRHHWFGETSFRRFPVLIEQLEAELESGNDILLMQLDFSQISLKQALVNFNIPAQAQIHPPITLAGYGRTNAKNVVNDNLLEIGVQLEKITEMDNGILVLTQGVGVDNGRVCLGDSGGPVFLGNLNGSEDVPISIVAIASGVRPNYGGLQDECADGRQMYTRVDRKDVREWLCTKAAIAC